MYKIFIDTNIILDFYRINKMESIKDILKEIKKHKKFFVSTKQSKDEFVRNREGEIQKFITILQKQQYQIHNNNVTATVDGYDEYVQSIKKANSATQKVLKEVKNLMENSEDDLIYEIFLNINQGAYDRTDEIIENASKRKKIGNPPYSDKYTCGDEIIWETLLKYCDEDLIIVSRDSTFEKNYHFLKTEYKEKKNKELKIVDSISKAIELNNEFPSQELELIESDIIIENELKEYGQIQENSNWANIVYNALIELNSEANLEEIYSEVKKIVKNKYPKKLQNNAIDETIRGVLQHYSSDSKNFNGKQDLFVNVKRGRWGIRKS